jgi:hypothetical protein
MAIYRTVSPNLWTDTKVVDNFTPEDKYFMLYLLTNPHANLLGCYEISVKQISDETGYTRDTIYNLIARFRNQYKIVDYSDNDKEVLIKNWYKYNWSRSPKTKTALEKLLIYVKCEQFRVYLKSIIKLRFENSDNVPENRVQNNRVQSTECRVQSTDTDVSIGYAYPIDRVSNKQDAQNSPSQMYGEYKNVILTLLELSELQKAYPQDWESKINRLSTYLKQTGKKYNNHYAVLMAWAKEDAEKHPAVASSFETNDFYEAALIKSYGNVELDK